MREVGEEALTTQLCRRRAAEWLAKAHEEPSKHFQYVHQAALWHKLAVLMESGAAVPERITKV